MSGFLDGLFTLEGEVAFVAGASSGIGAHVARTLARAGADVVLGARRLDRLEDLAREIEETHGRRALSVEMDVVDMASVQAAFKRAVEEVGTPTVICNNAGIGDPAWALEESEDAFQRMIDVNLTGMWRVAQTAAKALQVAGKKGSIINTASILGLGVGPMQSSYAVSKAGVVQLTKALALEFQRFGVRVNAICPGYFITEINDTFLESDAGQAMLEKTPARRSGRLDELDSAFLMFASAASSFTTGAVLPVDGAHSVKLAG